MLHLHIYLTFTSLCASQYSPHIYKDHMSHRHSVTEEMILVRIHTGLITTTYTYFVKLVRDTLIFLPYYPNKISVLHLQRPLSQSAPIKRNCTFQRLSFNHQGKRFILMWKQLACNDRQLGYRMVYRLERNIHSANDSLCNY